MAARASGRDAIVLACVAAGVLAGCSRASSPRPPARAPAPALAPTGSTARALDYLCRSGRHDSIMVDIPDARRLAQVVNAINVCEFDGGLQEVRLVIGCDPGAHPAPVRVIAVEGSLPVSTARTICGS